MSDVTTIIYVYTNTVDGFQGTPMDWRVMPCPS